MVDKDDFHFNDNPALISAQTEKNIYLLEECH